MDWINMVLLALVTAALSGLFWLELRLRATRTRVLQIPGGLYFEARDFSMQVLRKEQTLHVQYRHGVLAPAQGSAQAGVAPSGHAQYSFKALGFRAEVRAELAAVVPATQTPQADAAASSAAQQVAIVLHGADSSRLTLEKVHPVVASNFEAFFLQVRHWIDKLEWRAERERVRGLRSAAEAAQAEEHAQQVASLLRAAPPNQPLTPEAREAIAQAQIAQWRANAGFVGQHTVHQVDAKGFVVWFVDLASDGRITLHADKRTIHSSLLGASITPTGGDLELGVRDAFWTPDDPDLRMFKVLRGVKPEERRAWKERLEIIRDSLAA
jgi:hypothetical protein